MALAGPVILTIIENNSKTACIRVPTNSTSSYSSNYFICNSGYEKTGSGSGTSCVRKASIIKIPKNSHKVGSGWTCNTNYYRNNSKAFCLRVPPNSSSSYSSNYFICNSGYEKTGSGSGTSCVRKASIIKIPKNSHKVGSGWICNTNYYRNNSKTACLRVPANSTSSYSSNYFTCNPGYKNTGNSCLLKANSIKIPKNAHKDGSGWTCNTNYYRNNYADSNPTCLRVSRQFKHLHILVIISLVIQVMKIL